jgi:membrane protein DedA with SNARE-associated domain
MALESSLVPVPSELVMIPAGYLAAMGKLDPFLAVLAGGL